MDQLVKFNSALADHSAQNNPHLIDGIVLTKFDTIDDKVSTKSLHFYVKHQRNNATSGSGRIFHFNDVHYWSANHIRGHRTDVHRPQEP